jgi:iron(III) transport system substrate-binding protein
VHPVLPCEGVGYEIGSTAIIKGTRNLDAAKKFVDFALTAEGQQIGLDVKEYAIPTQRDVPLPPQVPKLTEVKVISYDFARYGSSSERKRLLDRWEKEINALSR